MCKNKIFFIQIIWKSGWLLSISFGNNYVLYWDFDIISYNEDLITHFTFETTPHNNFSHQNLSLENSYLKICIKKRWNHIFFASLFCTMYILMYKYKSEIISMHIAVNVYVYVRNYHKIRTLASAKKKLQIVLHATHFYIQR